MCHLRKLEGADASQDELIASLRASDLVVRRSIAELVAAGLVTVTEAGRVRYAPASAEADHLAGLAERRYATSPDAVRRIIVRAANPGLSAFADAFRLGGDR